MSIETFNFSVQGCASIGAVLYKGVQQLGNSVTVLYKGVHQLGNTS